MNSDFEDVLLLSQENCCVDVSVRRCTNSLIDAPAQKALNRSAVVSEILKYLPFYERLVKRFVSRAWNRSFYFSSCWECVDYRFLDLSKHEFYRSNLNRFISNVRRLDICIDQVPGFIRLLSNYGTKGYDSSRSISTNDDLCTFDLSLLGYKDECKITRLFDTLNKLKFLQISERCNRDKTIFTRVSPMILDSIELSYPSNANGVEVLIIDCPIDCVTLLELVPYMKNIKHLIITRIIDWSDDMYTNEFTICSIISELIEHIPKDQLLSLQIGKTLPILSVDYPKLVLSSDIKTRKFKRIQFAAYAFGPFNPIDECDELLSILIQKQQNSLEFVIMDDVDLSYEAYSRMKLFPNLKFSRVPVWSHLYNFCPSDTAIGAE